MKTIASLDSNKEIRELIDIIDALPIDQDNHGINQSEVLDNNRPDVPTEISGYFCLPAAPSLDEAIVVKRNGYYYDITSFLGTDEVFGEKTKVDSEYGEEFVNCEVINLD